MKACPDGVARAMAPPRERARRRRHGPIYLVLNVSLADGGMLERLLLVVCTEPRFAPSASYGMLSTPSLAKRNLHLCITSAASRCGTVATGDVEAIMSPRKSCSVIATRPSVEIRGVSR